MERNMGKSGFLVQNVIEEQRYVQIHFKLHNGVMKSTLFATG
jgi:hypothetical protein